MAVTDVSKLASCTSCTFDQDLSNYWTANVYFRARNGSFKRVPQMVNDQIGAANAGITVYYTAPGPKTVTAFKPVWLSLDHTDKRMRVLTWSGLPDVLRGRQPAQDQRIRQEHPELLPLLHWGQLWRQHELAMHGPAA